MVAASRTLIIDKEFRALIPAITPEEQVLLEANLKRDGCRDPLVLWQEEKILLDGHHRLFYCQKHDLPYKICKISLPDREAVRIWIISNQLGRRNLTPYHRAELVLKLKPAIVRRAKENQRQSIGRGQKGCQNSDNLKTTDTKRELADLAGVSHDTIVKTEYLHDHANEATKGKLRRGETTINAEYRRLRKEGAKREREQKKSAKVDLPEQIRLFQADITEAHKRVDAESLDWIITDPPYPKQYLPLYSHLAEFAHHALKPGGSLVAMVGQSYLPEIMSQLDERLDYHWTLAYLTPGGQAVQLWERKVNTFWKPLLWFTKGKYTGEWVGDVCRSDTNDNDKEHHQWGQSVSGMVDLLDRFTFPGQVVCDPFLGAGTTGIAAVAAKCRFVGFDIDADCVAKAETRIADSLHKEN